MITYVKRHRSPWAVEEEARMAGESSGRLRGADGGFRTGPPAPPPAAEGPAREPACPAQLSRGCTRPGCERVPAPFLLDLARFSRPDLGDVSIEV